ncbi:hypothetical protein N7494_010752 [Penicillium frequentans]|uniref:Uncharacterized protein n=1 Tax=Penicillium frequentans TaxID=3151616 RepID=A0AAD6CL82_9EURO|nr:hypothetical protein N7494_010752 [Penicillium glabrum]
MNKLLICSLLFLVFPVDALYDCLGLGCETCLPAEVYDAPGVGFDLTTSYGTASVHYFNGTVVDVAQIQGDSEYLELMMRFARKPKPSMVAKKSLYDELTPWLTLSDPSSIWGPWLRWFNKMLGRKGHSDIEIISDLLQKLQASAENEISQPLDRVAVTAPDFTSITPAINAALRDLNLRTWVGDSHYYPIRLVEADAIYASNGYGLCKNYHDRWDCIDEFESLPWPHVFTIFYSRHALYTSIINPGGGQALAGFNWDEAQIVDFEVGLDRLLQTSGSDALWARLRSQLSVLPREYQRPINHVLLAGESVTHPHFLATLRVVLSEILPSSVDLQNVLDADPAVSKIVDLTFAAARGAALYARRRQEVQSECKERPICEDIRRRERTRLPLREDLR